MITELELSRFVANLEVDENDPEGDVWATYARECYESCIPRSFWELEAADITHNPEIFELRIRKYVRRRRRMMSGGYGLLICGPNGSGKTTFACYIATQLIRCGYSVYYTTLKKLDSDLKQGFRDRVWHDRLRMMLFESDLVIVDETGKEHFKEDSWFTVEWEDFLKTRFDNKDPTILCSNMQSVSLCQLYGKTFESMVDARFVEVNLPSGDYRKLLRQKKSEVFR